MRTWTLMLAALALAPHTASAQQLLKLSAGFTPDPQSLAMRAGGNVEVDEGGGCDYGYIAESGAMGLDYTAGVLDLYVYVEGAGDSMLLVQTPSGRMLCDDDSHGDLNPRLHITDPESGRYIVFVGGYTENEYRDVTLFFSELSPDVFGSSEGTPSLLLDATFGDLDLGQGFSPDPHSVSLRAGGDIEVDVGGCSVGYVDDAASVDLTYNGGTDLHIYVRSDEDTTLLINTPDGSWICDDDTLGDSNPLVSIPRAASGLYDIWVGTYNGEEANATLYIASKPPK